MRKMNVVAILLIPALTYSTANACNSVETLDGDCCEFPFLYGGDTYYECTTDGWHRPWCSLTSNYDQDKKDGDCGNCTTVDTQEGGCCYFPFVAAGQTYNECTTYGWYQPWCSLTGNFTRDSQWGNCPACGYRPPSTRIVGGTQAQEDSWPWQALLARTGGSQFCGGSLIDEQWVLTAAHCVDGDDPSDVRVRMGAYKRTDTLSAQTLEVEQIIIHESYKSPVNKSHDIALLKLKTKATLGTGIGLVCLPDKSISLEPGKSCYITGWGSLASQGTVPLYLQEASVPIVSQEECYNTFGSDEFHDSMICAGFDVGGVDTCQGDSGGPLVCEFNGQWYLEGVTSWGHGCAEPNSPGVYANVRYLKCWVQNAMISN